VDPRACLCDVEKRIFLTLLGLELVQPIASRCTYYSVFRLGRSSTFSRNKSASHRIETFVGVLDTVRHCNQWDSLFQICVAAGFPPADCRKLTLQVIHKLKIKVIWYVTPSSLIDGYRCFGGICCVLYSEESDTKQDPRNIGTRVPQYRASLFRRS
jgi:hypothetical protein